MGNRPKARATPPPPPVRRSPRWRWVALLVLGALVFALLRGIHAVLPDPQSSEIISDHVVVVGVAGRSRLTDVDRTVLGAHLDDAQAGVVSVRPRYVGDCAAAGWTTLGAGRRAAVDGLCADAPVVADGAAWRVADWAARVAAAAARRGDARLGTLADSSPGCVAAVGPGAALAAARADGTVASYSTAPAFVVAKLPLRCPVTLVDAGPASDRVITTFAARDDVTLIVLGIGPAAGSDDPSLGIIYRLGTTFPGLLTSASTRREGVVTLTDLTRTLIDLARGPGGAVPLTVDGSPLAVDPSTLTVPTVEAEIAEVAALSDAAPAGYLSLGIGGGLLFLVMLAGTLRRRWILPERVLTLGTVLPAGTMLVGAVPWARAASPALVVSVAVWVWIAGLTFAAIGLSRLLRVPPAVAGAALSVTAFTVDAALGGPMQPGSLINSRPVFGLRWYGFGNVTFAAYATAGLLLAGWVASRFLVRGRRRSAVLAAGAIGFGVVVCEGWPSMGTDFGGVVALTPAVLWLCLALSGLRVTWRRLLVVGGSAVVAVAAISLLDWSRGPDRRSHLGNFVQRVIDGDAVDVVARKAVASAETIVSVAGLCSLLVGIPLWFVVFRYALPRLVGGFAMLRPVLVAVLVVAVLGTLVNDGGIFVWLTATGAAAAAVGCLWAATARSSGRNAPDPHRAGPRTPTLSP